MPLAHKTWTRADISFVLVDEITEHPVVTIEVVTPDGLILIMGEPREDGRTLVVERAHVSSRGIDRNDIGVRNLRLIATVIMSEMDYDDIRIEGEVRTTGANPGRRPRPFRFARNRDDPT